MQLQHEHHLQESGPCAGVPTLSQSGNGKPKHGSSRCTTQRLLPYRADAHVCCRMPGALQEATLAGRPDAEDAAPTCFPSLAPDRDLAAAPHFVAECFFLAQQAAHTCLLPAGDARCLQQPAVAWSVPYLCCHAGLLCCGIINAWRARPVFAVTKVAECCLICCSVPLQ